MVTCAWTREVVEPLQSYGGLGWNAMSPLSRRAICFHLTAKRCQIAALSTSGNRKELITERQESGEVPDPDFDGLQLQANCFHVVRGPETGTTSGRGGCAPASVNGLSPDAAGRIPSARRPLLRHSYEQIQDVGKGQLYIVAWRGFLWITPPLPNCPIFSIPVAGSPSPGAMVRQRRSVATGPAGRVGPVGTWITKVDPINSVVGPPSRLSPGSRMDAWVWNRIIASMGAGDHDKRSCRDRREQGKARCSP